MMPEIEIDRDKCTKPYDCKICLQICPEAVFMVQPNKIEPYKETNPEDYKLVATWRDKCVACMDCVKSCPNDALKIKV